MGKNKKNVHWAILQTESTLEAQEKLKRNPKVKRGATKLGAKAKNPRRIVEGSIERKN